MSGINLSGADLRKANLTRAYLRGAKLMNANLEGANLFMADLNQADLSQAKLMDANFKFANVSYANLSGAFLKNADFSNANLKKANLNGANFNYANLSEANLIETNLSETNLNNAQLFYSTFTRVDLSLTIGLDSVKHYGPSSLGIDTLMKSKGKIPEIFLRGCGITDDFISYIPSHFAKSAIEFYSCFISYSHKDKSFARRLNDALQGRGIRCWLDDHQILPGDNIYERVDHGIRVWDKVLLCASKHSLTSGWVDDELKHAFAKEKQLFKERGHEVLSLIPLNLDSHLFSEWKHPKRNQIHERLAADFIGWKSDNAKFEEQFERVVKALQTKDSGREPDPIPKL
nr:toll/interleukin-1 receptor domain-containing protein [Gimesia aquarii]